MWLGGIVLRGISTGRRRIREIFEQREGGLSICSCEVAPVRIFADRVILFDWQVMYILSKSIIKL